MVRNLCIFCLLACPTCFLSASGASMRRTVVLRLYLAAYQSTPAVQQACWNSVLKRVYSGLADECNSTETTAALAAYTASSAFDASVLVPVEAASFTV